MKKSSNNGSFGKRVLAVFLIILVFPFLLSVANLFKIQTIDSEKYKSKAEQNQLRDTEISMTPTAPCSPKAPRSGSSISTLAR